jgi:hypothetical protein
VEVLRFVTCEFPSLLPVLSLDAPHAWLEGASTHACFKGKQQPAIWLGQRSFVEVSDALVELSLKQRGALSVNKQGQASPKE